MSGTRRRQNFVARRPGVLTLTQTRIQRQTLGRVVNYDLLDRIKGRDVQDRLLRDATPSRSPSPSPEVVHDTIVMAPRTTGPTQAGPRAEVPTVQEDQSDDSPPPPSTPSVFSDGTIGPTPGVSPIADRHPDPVGPTAPTRITRANREQTLYAERIRIAIEHSEQWNHDDKYLLIQLQSLGFTPILPKAWRAKYDGLSYKLFAGSESAGVVTSEDDHPDTEEAMRPFLDDSLPRYSTSGRPEFIIPDTSGHEKAFRNLLEAGKAYRQERRKYNENEADLLDAERRLVLAIQSAIRLSWDSRLYRRDAYINWTIVTRQRDNPTRTPAQIVERTTPEFLADLACASLQKKEQTYAQRLDESRLNAAWDRKEFQLRAIEEEERVSRTAYRAAYQDAIRTCEKHRRRYFAKLRGLPLDINHPRMQRILHPLSQRVKRAAWRADRRYDELIAIRKLRVPRSYALCQVNGILTIAALEKDDSLMTIAAFDWTDEKLMVWAALAVMVLGEHCIRVLEEGFKIIPGECHEEILYGKKKDQETAE